MGLTTRFPFLQDDGIKRIMAALGTSTARVVGGAVRNTLMGMPVRDLDMATTHPPETTLAHLRKAGIHVIPTGLKHGTITAIIDSTPYEITTLRTETAHTGRHASVAYIEDWEQDALRRDFTINAMSVDSAGTLYDYTHGQHDAANRIVRFIGTPATRIQEDALRVLRFFRFSAIYANTLDPDGLNACIAAKASLSHLSAERIRQELFHLLEDGHAMRVLATMQTHHILPHLTFNMPALQRIYGQPPSIMPYLATLHQDVTTISNALALSGKQRTHLQTLHKHQHDALSKPLLRAIGAEYYRDLAYMHYAHRTIDEPALHDALSLAIHWHPPTFPLTGHDLIALGATSGATLGDTLNTLETYWEAQAYRPDREALLAKAKELLSHL